MLDSITDQLGGGGGVKNDVTAHHSWLRNRAIFSWISRYVTRRISLATKKNACDADCITIVSEHLLSLRLANHFVRLLWVLVVV